MTPPPPRSTLFPYTTLFRSHAVHRQHERRRERREVQVAARVVAPLLVRAADRKSTRLNSSHRTISYAVFCLKKKKRNLAVIVDHQFIDHALNLFLGVCRSGI